MGIKNYYKMITILVCSLLCFTGCSTKDSAITQSNVTQQNTGLTELTQLHLQDKYIPEYVTEDENSGDIYCVVLNKEYESLADASAILIAEKKEDGSYRAPVKIINTGINIIFHTMCLNAEGTKVYFSGMEESDIGENGNATAMHIYQAEIKDYKLQNIEKLDVGLPYVAVYDVDQEENLYLINYDTSEFVKAAITETGYETEVIETGIDQTGCGSGFYLDEQDKLILGIGYKGKEVYSLLKKDMKENGEQEADQEIALPSQLDDYAMISGSVSSAKTNAYFVCVDDQYSWESSDFHIFTIKTEDLLANTDPVIKEYTPCSYDEYDTAQFEDKLRNKQGMEQKQGVYYEIFVRSFADSDGDGIGDFNGITQKLDYLKDLGIDGIWLMPINPSPSYHGYDVTDYNTVNQEYGTEEDFQILLNEAHKRNIKIIMDFVVNHTSSEHPWFQDACQNKDGAYANYYRWVNKLDTEDLSGPSTSNWGSMLWHKVGKDYYYGIFTEDMPDLNYNNPKVREEIKTSAQKWLKMGVDGFRLDAAIHIYGQSEFAQVEDTLAANKQWWNEFAIACEEINPNVYLVGEAWEDNKVFADYAQPFDTKFDFSMELDLLQAVKEEKALTADHKELLSQELTDILQQYAQYDSYFIDGVFGSNHDQERIMSQVQSEEKAKLVANVYLTLPGNPFIYYGEEIGMQGVKPDEQIREPFKWSSDGSDLDTKWEANTNNTETVSLQEQMQQDTDNMYHHYKELIALRKSHTALKSGNYQAVDVNNDAVMAYSRESDDENLLVLHNLSGEEVEIINDEINDRSVIYGNDISVHGNRIVLPPYTSVILKK